MSIIKELELTENQVQKIVYEWYMSIPDVIQNENGEDLDEILNIDYSEP